MSHVHHLGGYSQAAGQYQEYLGKLRSARLARRSRLAEASDEPLSFDSAIDAEQEPDQQDQQAPQEDGQASRADSSDPEAPSGLNEHA